MFTAAKRLSLLSLVALAVPPVALAHPDRYDAAPYRDPAPTGTVYVSNRASGTVTAVVDGVSVVLPAGRTQAVRARIGEVQVRASVRVFGQERVLAFRTVAVRRDGAAYVTVVDPTTALVRVENESDRPAELRVDGRFVASFGPDETRMVSVAVGAHELAMVAGGWTFDRARMVFAPCGEAVFEAEMPRSNDLVVQNPLPIPVQVQADRGATVTIDAYGQAVLRDLPLGGVHVEARRLSGQRVDEAYATIRPEAPTTVRVDAPTTGLVDLHNDAPFLVRVVVDGRTVRMLAPEDDAELELTLGVHDVEVVDDRGHELLDRDLAVDAYATARLVARMPDRGYDEDAHAHHHDDDRASSERERSDAVAAYDAEDHRHR